MKRMKEKMIVFDQLRKAMRIAEPAGKLGLNDPGSGSMKHIETRVRKFYQGICELDEKQERIYRNMRIAQIDSSVVRDLLCNEAKLVDKVAPEIKRLIKNPKLPNQLIALFHTS